MCMFSYQSEPAIADKPIKCVKIMRHVKRGTFAGQMLQLYSFVNHTKYQLGKLEIMCEFFGDDELFMSPKKLDLWPGSKRDTDIKEALHNFDKDMPEEADAYSIERGICAFENIQEAQTTFEWACGLFRNTDIDICLVECEIPTGTLYYKGISNCTNCMKGERGYVAQAILPLKVIKEVNPDEWFRKKQLGEEV